MKTIYFSIILAFVTLYSCQGSSVKSENIPILGKWVASQTSFDHAREEGDYQVNVLPNGIMEITGINSQQEKVDQRTWVFEKGKLKITKEDEDTILADVFLEGENQKWDRQGKILYLVPISQYKGK